MRRIGAALVGLILGAVMAITGIPAAAESWPLCGNVEQPSIPDPVITAEGVTFRWEGGSPPVLDRYALDIGRRSNGVTVAEGWREVNESVHEWFVPWTSGGVRADALVLSVLNICAGEQNGPERWVWFSDWERLQAAEAVANAASEATAHSEAGAGLEQEVTRQESATVKCINKRSFKKKRFAGSWGARQKCPRGWIKI